MENISELMLDMKHAMTSVVHGHILIITQQVVDKEEWKQYFTSVIDIHTGHISALIKSPTKERAQEKHTLMLSEYSKVPGNPNTVVAPEQIKEYACPLCSSPMKLKVGKHGVFYGCSTWSKTKCEGILDTNGVPSLHCQEILKQKHEKLIKNQIMSDRLAQIDID